MKKYIAIPFVVCVFVITALGQKTPTFSQYSAHVERARAKSIDFSRPSNKTYKTRLSEALRDGVNFAGHYVIVGWGCGTGCTNAAVIDGRTGKVFWPVQFYNIDASYGDGYSDEQIEFKKNSRLMVIHGRPGSSNENDHSKPGDYYYEWRNNSFRRLKFVEKK